MAGGPLITARELVRAATAAGAKLAVSGDKLSVTAPSPLAPELVQELRRSKVEILRLLATEAGRGHPPPANAAWWRRHFTIRTLHWGLSARWTKDEAERLAYGELLDEWRKPQGRRWPVWQCAGCDEPIGGLSALLLADENRVHFDEERECLIRFGGRAGGEAVAGLQALGIDPPPGFEAP
jgi:hypothetical protein